jgi:cytochrome oxidase Cu insertion factor (SCO1/SenC/PrrC family)
MKLYFGSRITLVVRTSALVLAALLFACAFSPGQEDSYPKPQIPSAVGQAAADFTLKDQDGKDFKLSAQRGHWVLLFFYRGYW